MSENSPSETKIRDYVSQHLHLIEDGLVLEDVEHYLPNPHGSVGFVDILARDRFGQLVVIELKRSDQAARQAIHELHKYTSLLRLHHGLSEDRVRCFLVSTTWRELIVPFSAYVASVSYNVVGLELTLAGGVPFEATVVNPLPTDPELELCPKYLWLFFSSEESRAEAIGRLQSMMAEWFVMDALIVSQRYRGDNPRVLYRYAFTFAQSFYETANWRPILSAFAEVESEERDATEMDAWVEEMLESAGDGIGYVEESVQSVFTGELSYGDLSISYPERFRESQASWVITDIQRHGRYASQTAWPYHSLIDALSSLEGPYATVFRTMTSVAHAARWNKLLDAAEVCLTGAGDWSRLFRPCMAEVSARSPNAVVSIVIHNPADLIWQLAGLAYNHAMVAPIFEVAVDSPDPTHNRLFNGVVVWDGVTKPTSVTEVFSRVEELAGHTFDYFMARQFHVTHEFEEQLASEHGLNYQLWEHQSDGSQRGEFWQLDLDADSVVRRPLNPDQQSLQEFIDCNDAYLNEIRAFFDRHTMPGLGFFDNGTEN